MRLLESALPQNGICTGRAAQQLRWRRCGRVVPAGLLWLGALWLGANGAWAQSPSEQVTGPTQATTVPISGRSAGGGAVTATQTTNPGGVNSITSSTSTVNIAPPYNGSTPSGPASAVEVPLTLAQALELGFKYNLGAVQQPNSVLQARGQREVAKSALLPNLNAAVSEVFERENLRTVGISLPIIPESVKYNYFDARAARLNQSIFDLVRTENLHAASENLKASLETARDSRDLVVLAIGGSYLQLLSTAARVQAAQAQVASSLATSRQAQARFEAGVSVRVDVTRSTVQLQSDQQRLRSLQADLETQKLRLARLIGLPLGQGFRTTEDFHFVPLTDYTLESALARAQTQRADLQAAASGVRAAESGLKAAHNERIPNLAVSADFGAAGLTPTRHATGVYTVAGTLTIPLYEGGRIQGEVDQATASLRQRKAELEDTRGQVDQDVRQAFINLNAAADQVGVAKSNVDLSHQALVQSQDRFAAGIADTVEVVQAQQAVTQADDDFINAVFEHNLAKVSLARAMGNAEQTLPQLLRK